MAQAAAAADAPLEVTKSTVYQDPDQKPRLLCKIRNRIEILTNFTVRFLVLIGRETKT